MRAAAAALILLVNLWVCQKWLGLEFTNARGSIEWVYLGLARYYAQHGFSVVAGDAEWFPFWYNGVPIENTYPPLLHYLVAFVSWMAKISAGRAFHLVSGACFCIAPLGVFHLALRFTQKTVPSLCAALFYSLFSPCAWLMPSIARDLNGYWYNQRMNTMFVYGESPHLLSLALIPFAMVALDWALQKPGWRRIALAAFACALVPLSNIIGGFAFAWAALAILCRHNWRQWTWALAVATWAYLLSLRWLHPATLKDLQHNAQFVGD